MVSAFTRPSIVFIDALATQRHRFFVHLTRQCSHSPCLPLSLQVFELFSFFIMFLYYLSYYLLLGVTFVFEFVLMLFFIVVSVLTFNSTLTTSAFFRRWLLIPMGIDMLVLFCTFFTYETALCGLLKGPDHFFLSYFLLFVALFGLCWAYCWRIHPFFFYRISNFFFLWDQKW